MDDSYNGRQKCGELAVKFDFPPTPSPLNNVDFSFFLGMTDHRAYITLNGWGRGDFHKLNYGNDLEPAIGQPQRKYLLP